MNKKIVVSALLISCLILATPTLHNAYRWLRLPMICFVWAADAYGSDIQFIEVWQDNGTHYELRENFTSSGGSVRVVDGDFIMFNVSIRFNFTLATNAAQARDYTRVNMSITDGGTIWDQETLNATGSVDVDASYWYLFEWGYWNQTGYPAAGTTYNCTAYYEGYY